MNFLELLWNAMDKLLGGSNAGKPRNVRMQRDLEHPGVERVLESIANALDHIAEGKKSSNERKNEKFKERRSRNQTQTLPGEIPPSGFYGEQQRYDPELGGGRRTGTRYT